MNYLLDTMPYPIYVGSLTVILAIAIFATIKYSKKLLTFRNFFFTFGMIIICILLIMIRTMRDFQIFLPQKPIVDTIMYVILIIYLLYALVMAWPVIHNKRSIYIPLIICGIIMLLGISIFLLAMFFPSLFGS